MRELGRTIAFSSVLSALIFTGCMLAFWFDLLPQHGNSPILFAALLLASIIRSCSDMLNVGLSSTTRDKSYAMINILGVPVSLVFTFAFVSMFGLMGAGVSAVLSALLLVAMRSVMLRRLYRQGGGAHAGPR
jgi:O-antigen/teichoic acid export membrane protein